MLVDQARSFLSNKIDTCTEIEGGIIIDKLLLQSRAQTPVVGAVLPGLMANWYETTSRNQLGGKWG